MLRQSLCALSLLVSSALWSQTTAPLGDWPEIRGPHRDGTSKEKGLPEKWAVNGEGMLWRAPYGGRSAPIVIGNRVCVQNPAGAGERLQERVMCVDADTGKFLWEYRFNVFQSDVPTHRVGWPSPAADPATGNVYALGVGGMVVALSRDGKVVWEKSLTEEFVPFTTHGGRTVSPLIDGDLVIVGAATSTWGTQANRSHRFIALDKRTGDVIWVSSPSQRPYDTTYANPIIANVKGMRLFIEGAGDGAVHAIKVSTGEPVWRFEMAKRGINTGVVMSGNLAIVSHSEENLDTSQMGMIAAIDATAKGAVGKEHIKWSVKGFQAGFSSPILDGDRILQVDNGSVLYAFDSVTGRELWRKNLGTVQKAPLVHADGKLYVGTENGKFYILRPHQDRVEILSEVLLPISKQSVAQSEGTPEQIIAGAAVSRGRVYFVTSDAIYAIGPKKASVLNGFAVNETLEKGQGPAAWIQIAPTELILKPGQTVKLRARAFDALGRPLGDVTGAQWSLEGLRGTVADGEVKIAPENVGQAGLIKAASGGVTGIARARVIPPLPWNETFDSYPAGQPPPHWVSATAGKFAVQELDGQKVLVKPPDESLFKRMRAFFGPSDWSNYTVEADVRFNERRRQLGDAGITAQRYTLRLSGSTEKLTIESWEPETKRVVGIPFPAEKDVWYRLKIRVENTAGGGTRAQGKVWKRDTPEPAKWMIEKVDVVPNRHGAAGLFADATFGVFFDNLKISAN